MHAHGSLQWFALIVWITGAGLFAASWANRRLLREPGAWKIFAACYLGHVFCLAMLLVTLHWQFLPRPARFYFDSILLGGILVTLAVSIVVALEFTTRRRTLLLAPACSLLAFAILILQLRHPS